MKFNARIKEQTSFSIVIDDIEHTGFTIESEWNGLICYKNKEGQIIAHKGNSQSFNIGKFLGLPSSEGEFEELQIVSISPCLMPETTSNEELICFNRDQAEIFIQWFNSVQDCNEQYLNPDDFRLAKNLLESLGLRVPNSVSIKVDG